MPEINDVDQTILVNNYKDFLEKLSEESKKFFKYQQKLREAADKKLLENEIDPILVKRAIESFNKEELKKHRKKMNKTKKFIYHYENQQQKYVYGHLLENYFKNGWKLGRLKGKTE